MSFRVAAGLAVDKVFVPAVVVGTVYVGLSRLLSHPLDIVNALRGVVVPAIILIFLILSRPPKASQLNVSSAVGILLSFAGFYFFDAVVGVPPVPLFIFALAATLFYLSLSIWSYLILGKNLSVIPALREIVSSGPYDLVRHPIYACYLHLAISYAVLLPSVNNLMAALMVFAGLFLRANEEEALLVLDPSYAAYRKKVPMRFISFVISFPLIVLFVIAVVYHFYGYRKYFGDRSPLVVQFAHPATSLNPVFYDDWSSVFLGNHIYPRLLIEESRPEALAVVRNLKLTCKDREGLNQDCPFLKLTFTIVPFSDCEGRVYEAADIENEFFQILNKKSWVLPNMKRCEARLPEVCVELPNVPDVKRRLRNLYVRFGWSKVAATDKKIGAGPYCLSILKRDGDEVQAGILKARSSASLPALIRFHTSTDVKQNFNIALYGTSELLAGNRVNVMTHTPLGYYVVTNPRIGSYSIPWNSESAKNIIKAHLLQTNVIHSEADKLMDMLPKGAASSPETVGHSKGKVSHVFALPDYIPQCETLRDQLNEHWRSRKLKQRAECINTSYFVEQVMKDKARKWGGFLTPLSPGAPGRNAIQYQYFSHDSNEAWTGREKRSERFYYLVGVGQSFVTVDNSAICGLKPNSMGHGDVFISDFIACVK
jgi:protein-S-isoprenylcysteine O-methyltransferase Ste14